MNSVRSKIFLIYLVFTIGILGLAGFSYYSSQQLTEKIENLAKPNKKSIYLKEINSSLTKFTNLYFEASGTNFFSKDHDDIIKVIKEKIALLRNEYDPSETETLEALDSIPVILDRIAKAHSEIRYLNRQYRDDFYQRVEEEILKKITIGDLKDAGYVEEKVRSEIIKIIEKDTAIKESIKSKQKKIGILDRLLGEKEKPVDESNKEKTNITERVNNVKNQALLSSEIDDLFFSKKVEYIKNEVNKVLYQEQIKAIKIRDKERQIFNSNVALINKLESIFRKIQREEDAKLRETTISTYNASKDFNKILIIIIIGFGISSLAILFFLFKDIERNRYYQSRLKDSERRANQKAMEKQKFLSTMSHELRTPLTSILGFSELLDNNIEYKKPIYTSTKYLLGIVNQIFDLAKLEEGKIEIKNEPVNITVLLNELKLNFKEIIEEAGLEAEFSIPQDNCFIRTDSFRINQILYNLVHNATKFTEKGKVSLLADYTPSSESNKTKLNIKIVDTGRGIPQQDQVKIFQEYEQSGDEIDKKKGLGIGLGLVKKILSEMKGEIRLESKEGEGSCFEIILDCENATEESIQKEMESLVFDETYLEHCNILTLDDDDFLLKLYSDLLLTAGANVIMEKNPYRALEILKKSPNIQLLITDIKMPGMTGIEVVQKAKGFMPNTFRAIGVTANIFFYEEYKNQVKYFDDILFKPFSREDFFKKSKYLLNQSISKPVAVNNTSFDFSTFNKLSMNDPELLEENLQLFYNQNLQDLDRLKSLLTENNFQSASEMIHKLSGRISQVTKDYRSNAKEIELGLRAEKTEFLEKARELTLEWEKINEDIHSRITPTTRKPFPIH